MDLYFQACQGLGLALAAGGLGGALAGAAGEPGSRGGFTPALAVLAIVGGAILFGWSLTQEDHPAWPGWLAGAAAALFAFVVVGGVVSGARTRMAEGRSPASPMAMVGIVVVAALALAGLSLLLPPISLPVAAGLIWLAASRRRRAQRKYEGLRVLR
jgi:hypothetical protein